MERSKIEQAIRDRFGGDIPNAEYLNDYDLLLLLVADDLKCRNLSLKQIQIKYNITERRARTLKFRIMNTVVKMKVGSPG